MSRCWAPSCRLRSSRCRSLCPAAMTRARDPRSSSSRALSSACNRAFSSAIPAAAVTEARSSGSSVSAGSCTSAATRSPSRSISVVARPAPVRQVHAPTVEVGVAPEVGEPVRERQRRVAERTCQGITNVSGSRIPAQLDEEPGDRGPASRASRRPIRNATGARPIGEGGPADLPDCGPSNTMDRNRTAIMRSPSPNQSTIRDRDVAAACRLAGVDRPARRPPRPAERSSARAEPAAPRGRRRIRRDLEQVVRAEAADRHARQLQRDRGCIRSRRPLARPPSRPLGNARKRCRKRTGARNRAPVRSCTRRRWSSTRASRGSSRTPPRPSEARSDSPVAASRRPGREYVRHRVPVDEDCHDERLAELGRDGLAVERGDEREGGSTAPGERDGPERPRLE